MEPGLHDGLLVFKGSSPEVALRNLRNKLRLAQVLLALLTMLVSAVPDLRGVHGFRVGEVALVDPLDKQETRETVAPQVRVAGDIEEFVGNDEPGAKIRGVILALSDDGRLKRCDQSWTTARRDSCAHPPTGPPAA